MAWLTNWDYRKSLGIDGSAAGQQTNYQKKLMVYSAENSRQACLAGTSTEDNGWGVQYPYERLIQHMAGRIWIFYEDGTNIVYKSSIDTINWSDPVTLKAASVVHSISTYFDGTYLHYVYAPNDVDGADVMYRRGTPDAAGDITWSAVEQVAISVPAGEGSTYPTICVDDSGYPWIGVYYYKSDNSINYVRVTKASTNNGTWTTANGFPYDLVTQEGVSNQVKVPVPALLTSGKVLWVYNTATLSDYYRARLWNGSSWEDEEQASEQLSTYANFNVVPDGDNVHFVYLSYATGYTYYRKRTYGSGWGTEETLLTTPLTCPALTLTGTDSLIFFYPDLTDGHVFYKEMINGVWQDSVDWLDESADGSTEWPTISATQSSSEWNKASVIFTTKAASPFNVKVASLVTDYAGHVVLGGNGNSDFSDARFCKSDGETLLDYWLESKVDDQYAVIWVEVDTIPASPSSGTIYIYYGNSEATTLSSGANTFIVFDNFERGNNDDTIGGDWTEMVAHVHISTDHAFTGTRSAKGVGAAATACRASIVSALSANKAIRFRLWKEDASYFTLWHGDADEAWILVFGTDETVKYYDATPTLQATGKSISAGKWILIEIRDFDTTADTCNIVINNNDIAVAGDNYGSAFANGTVVIENGNATGGKSGDGNDFYVDDFLVRNYANPEPTWGEAGEEITIPDAPTNVAATNGVYTDKVTVTWTKSDTATGYRVYRDSADVSGLLGDVATYDDTGADAPTIVPGTADASNGTYTDKVVLDLSDAVANIGSVHTYQVTAINEAGESDKSDFDTGYRGVGSLTYQWQRSAGDSDASYSNISGATTDPYSDTDAPAPTVTPGTADASDGAYADKVVLSLSGESASNGTGRYYKCVLSATGAESAESTADRGYIGAGAVTYQWLVSSADADGDYTNITGATTDPYNYEDAPVNAGRYYECIVSATGADSQYSTSDRGYKAFSGRNLLLILEDD